MAHRIADPTTRKLWRALRRPDCTRCPLHEGANTVCLLGDGPTPATMMIIGEAPGEREDEDEFRPFAGAAGRLLDRTLEENGLDRSMFYVTNAAKCRPPANRTPKKSEIVACNVYLRAELRVHKPKYVLLLGNSALQAALGVTGVMARRQQVVERDGVKYFAAVHPAAGLRRAAYKQMFLDDIAAFARFVKGTDYSMSTVTHLVNTPTAFNAFLKRLEAAPTVAFDIETEGPLHPAAGQKPGTITLFGASFAVGEAWVVPLDHAEGWAPKKWVEIAKAIARRLFGHGKKLIAHNGKYDVGWFLKYEPDAEYTFDTMFAAFLLNENRSMALENLALQELKVKPWKQDVQYRRDFPLSKYAAYNAKDCDYTLRLYELYKSELMKWPRLRRVFQRLMMPIVNIFTRIEDRGVYLPEKRLKERTEEAKKLEAEELAKLRSFVPDTFKVFDSKGREKPFNPRSSEQMARLLYGDDGLNLPFPAAAGEKAAAANKGLGSTAEGPMSLLDHPITKVIERWRYLESKVLNTYFNRWWGLRGADGFVHFRYNLIGAVTGRISSDLHQVPRDEFVRGVLSVDDADEWYWGAADFSQAEMRLAAHLSQDPRLLHIFRTAEIDVHTNTAMRISGKKKSAITSEDRKKAKPVNFGFLYRMFEKKFQDYARLKFEVTLTRQEAKNYRRSFFDEYARLEEWHNRMIRRVQNDGEVQYLDGRIRRLPDIWSENPGLRSEAERQAINSPVQGVVSDMILFAMVIGELGGYGLAPLVDKDFLWMGQMHDETFFKVRKSAADRKCAQLKEMMENLPLKEAFGFDLSIPIISEIKLGTYWGETKEWIPATPRGAEKSSAPATKLVGKPA